MNFTGVDIDYDPLLLKEKGGGKGAGRTTSKIFAEVLVRKAATPGRGEDEAGRNRRPPLGRDPRWWGVSWERDSMVLSPFRFIPTTTTLGRGRAQAPGRAYRDEEHPAEGCVCKGTPSERQHDPGEKR